ncbi:MAG: tetratricopeptide repeat protein [Anaerolineae bacterium]|nr:tetratricopeptide repeat protein [Gemmatimonadaceae bacterium]
MMLTRLRKFTFALAIAARLGAQENPAERGVQLFELAQYEEAKKELGAELKHDQKATTALFYLGRIAMVEGDFNEASRLFERTTRSKDATSEHYRWLAQALGQMAARGSKLKAPFVAKKAKAALERAVSMDPDNVESRVALLRYYLIAPGMMGGSTERAARQVPEIAKRSPFWGRLAAAGVHEDRKDDAAAEREYEKAIEEYPDSASGLYALGLLYQRTEQNDKAFATFERMVEKHPDKINALYAIGRLGAQTGKNLERSETALTSFLSMPVKEGHVPRSSAHYRLGMVYEKTGRRELARKEYETSLRLEQRSEVRDALARVK